MEEEGAVEAPARPAAGAPAPIAKGEQTYRPAGPATAPGVSAGRNPLLLNGHTVY
jgi:hypothetical protein